MTEKNFYNIAFIYPHSSLILIMRYRQSHTFFDGVSHHSVDYEASHSSLRIRNDGLLLRHPNCLPY